MKAYDVIKAANKKSTHASVVKVLQENNTNQVLKMLLFMNYSKQFKSALPKGAPPYDIPVEPRRRLDDCLNEFPNWSVPHSNRLNMMQKEGSFYGVLNDIPKEESELLIACKDRSVDTLYPKITEEAVKEAFPEMFPA